MKVKEILQMIPDEALEMLAAESKVNYQVKKLTGKTVFQLILFSLLTAERVSLRVMEELFHSMQFRLLADIGGVETKYNSIRDRIAVINPQYFERIFHLAFDRFNTLLKEQQALIRYDSTMIAVSSKLVEWGMHVGSKTDKVQLKYTIATKGSFPCHVEIFDKPEALSEDKTIPVAIFSDDHSKTGIVVFDRGVQHRKVFKELSDTSRLFVTRAKTDVRYTLVKKQVIKNHISESSVHVEEDLLVQLRDANSHRIDPPFRLIKAIIKSTNEKIYFLSNIDKLSPYEIAAIYRQRWEIENFFKFLKRHLHLNHLVDRNTNGIKVMIYMTLILSILLIAYKKFNHLNGYQQAKLRFTLELEKQIIQQIVLLCAGDPGRMPCLFNDS
jgi:Transposase DDE domain